MAKAVIKILIIIAFIFCVSNVFIRCCLDKNIIANLLLFMIICNVAFQSRQNS